MVHDMTDRIEFDLKTVTVLVPDFDAAVARWRKKGWTVVQTRKVNAKRAARGIVPAVVQIDVRRPVGSHIR